MRIEQLTYILEVARCKSISQAAKKLYLSQPSLSASISNLEKELKTKIFCRSLNGVEPTDKGKLIVEQAKVIVNEITRLKNICTENPNVLKGNISVSTLPALCNYILLEVFSVFKQKHSKVNMIIKENDNCNILKELEAGNTDIGVIGLFQHEKEDFLTLIKQKNLYYQELLTDQLCIYASSNHPLLQKKYIYLEDTYNYPLIIYKNNFSQRDLIKLNLNYSSVLRFNDRESIKKMVGIGNSLAILPRLTSINDLYVISKNIVPLDVVDFNIPLFLCIICGRGNYLFNIEQEFIKILKEIITDIRN